MWANVIVLLKVESVNQLAALMALGPEIVGEILIPFAASQWWFLEDAHVVFEARLGTKMARDNGRLWLDYSQSMPFRL